MLHAKYKCLVFLLAAIVNVLANFGVVDLTGAGLFSARIISCLEIAYLGPTLVDVGNEVSFGDLLMINVKQDFAGRTIDRPANGKGLVGTLQKDSTMVGSPIQWLQNHGQLVGFQ